MSTQTLIERQQPAPIPLVRDDLVSTAVSFLLNPQIRNNPIEKKRSFLVNKGLTINEINMAFEWADKGIPYQPMVNQHQPHHVPIIRQPPPMIPYPNFNGPYPGNNQYSSPGVWLLTRALVPSLALLTGIAAAIYLFYKQFVEPYFFGPQKSKPKHPLVVVTENVDKLTKSVDTLKGSLVTFEQSIKRSMEESVGKVIMEITSRRTVGSGAASSDEVASVKKEVQSLKALLLSRNQFPESPIVSFIQQTSAALNGTTNGKGSSDGSPPMAQSPPPSIPSWQLTDESKEEELKDKQ